MLSLAKTILYLDVLILIGIYLFLFLTKKDLTRKYKYSLYVAGLGVLPIFLIPNVYGAYVLLALFIMAIGRDRDRLLVALMVCCLLSPPLNPSPTVGSTLIMAFPIELVASAAALIALLFTKKEPGPIRWTRDAPLLLLVLLFWFVDARGTSATNWMRSGLYCLLLYVAPYIIVRSCLKTEERIKFLLAVLACVTMLFAIICLFETIRRWPTYFAFGFYHQMDTLMASKMRGGALRAPGPLMNPPATAEILAIGFFALIACRDLFRTRGKYYAALAIVLLGLFAPQSRGAWIGVLVGLLATGAIRKGFKGIALQGGMAMVAGLMVLAMVPFSEKLSYMLGLRGDGLVTSDYRTRLFDSGMVEIRNHPLLGQSMDVLMIHLSDLRQGEQIIDFVNSYLYVAMVSGLIGLALFVAAFGLQSFSAWRIGRRDGAADRLSYVAFGFPAILTAATMLLFTSIDKRVMWLTLIVFAISNATADVLERRRVQTPVAKEPAPPEEAARGSAVTPLTA